MALFSRIEQLAPWQVFAFFGVLCGLALCLITPPYGVPDEPSHLYRIWSVAQGNLVDTRIEDRAGQWVPQDMVDTEHAWFRKRPDSPALLTGGIGTAQTFVDNRQYVLYSPVPYLPQVIGVKLGQMAGLSMLGCHYLGRILALLAFAALTAWGIALMPRFFGWMLAVVALLPMTLYQAASLSADSMTLGLSFLLTGLLFRTTPWFVDTGRRCAATLLTFCALALSKTGYTVLGLLALLSFNKMTIRQRWMTAGLLAAGVLCAVAWAQMISGLYVPLAGHVDPGQQMNTLAVQPLGFFDKAMNIVVRAFLKGKNGFYQIIGVLGWLDVRLPEWIYWSYLAIFPAVAFTFSEPAEMESAERLGWLRRGWILAILTLGVLLIFFWLYVSYNSVNNFKIEGLQGRYFLPFLGPFLMALAVPAVRFPHKVKFLVACMLAVWTGVFYTLF